MKQFAGQPDGWMVSGAEPVGRGPVDDQPREDIQAVHRRRDARLDDAGRRFGILPDVELRDRRDVAGARRAAHEEDPVEVIRDLRMLGEQHGDVGLGSEADERDRLGRRHDLPTQHLHRRQ